MKHTYDYDATKKHLELKKQNLCKKLSNMTAIWKRTWTTKAWNWQLWIYFKSSRNESLWTRIFSL